MNNDEILGVMNISFAEPFSIDEELLQTLHLLGQTEAANRLAGDLRRLPGVVEKNRNIRLYADTRRRILVTHWAPPVQSPFERRGCEHSIR